MKAAPIFQALEALRMVKDGPASIPQDIWSLCMTAFHRLDGELQMAGIRAEVEQKQSEESAA